MDQEHLRKLLEDVKGGSVNVDAALEKLRHMPFEDLGFAKVDHHRAIRHGIPEVIFGKGKTPEQIIAIASKLAERAHNVLITRVDPSAAAHIVGALPEGAEHFSLSGAIRIWRDKTVHGRGKLAVVCAGTTDIPVAEEAQITAELMGNEIDAIYDIGVAGIHRLMQNRERLTSARVVVCAGMEGALPSVVGGLVSCPVIAVPTSVGYGASFHGLAALLGMLNSCASNVTVVNIDNGFGAGYVASLINRM